MLVMKSLVKKFKVPETKVMLVIIMVLSLIVLRYNWVIGSWSLIVSCGIVYYIYRAEKKRDKEITQYMERLTFSLDLATKDAILTVPMPVVVTGMDGTIIWYNKHFEEAVDEEGLIGNNLNGLLPDFQIDPLIEDVDSYEQVKFKDRLYNITWSPIQIDKDIEESNVLLLLYLEDVTIQTAVEERYKRGQLAMAYIYVDNYDEVLANTEEADKPMLTAEIEGKLSRWATGLNAGWQKYERDKYIMIMDSEILDRVEKDKFSILDEIREINPENQMNPTLSIGVGVEADSPLHNLDYARTALDMALGRGGDQTAVKRGTKLYFYGGKTKAVEKRTKVKSRVIAGVLRELMEQSERVYIMSHQLPDLDSLGSAMGIYRCARHIKKEAYIILDKANHSVDYLLKEIHKRDEYKDLFIHPQLAKENMNNNTLLVVVDVHRPSFTELPELLNMAEKIVAIDHHRRSAEAIENATLAYLEPYASSASELVAEIIQYFDEKIRLNPLEADAILAGITMDTKSFTFKTGVRTFEAAAYLKRGGADPTSVRQFFNDDMETYAARADTVKNAQIIMPGIAVSQCPLGAQNPSLIAAQAADSLLTIHGIHASFVLAQEDDVILISGRSMGNINMQVILEKLGGGGHMTIAGAQIYNASMEEAKTRVTHAVKQYLEEEGEGK